MRTLEEIQNEIITAKESNPELSRLSSTSKSAIWRNLVYTISFAIWLLENIFQQHKKEVDTALLELTPHTPRWYRNKALAFQYGFDLLTDSDKYNNEGFTEEQIANSKIIKYSAVVEAETESRLIIKIATEKNDELNPIDVQEQQTFEAYIKEIKDAGVRITVINYEPDILRLGIRIVRNPLVLDANGMSILTGKYPIQDDLQEFMKELPFNGELILQDLANKLEKTEGVKIVQIDYAQSKWIDADLGGYGSFENIDMRKVPVSGYFKIEDFNNVSYVV